MCRGLDPALLAHIKEQPWSSEDCFPGASQGDDEEEGAAGGMRAPGPSSSRVEASAAVERSAPLSSIANTGAAAGRGPAAPGAAALQYTRKRKGFKPPRPLQGAPSL